MSLSGWGWEVLLVHLTRGKRPFNIDKSKCWYMLNDIYSKSLLFRIFKLIFSKVIKV